MIFGCFYSLRSYTDSGFTLLHSVIKDFKDLQKDIAKSTIIVMDPSVPLIVETDVFNSTIIPSLRQSDQPILFQEHPYSPSSSNNGWKCGRHHIEGTKKMMTLSYWMPFKIHHWPEVNPQNIGQNKEWKNREVENGNFLFSFQPLLTVDIISRWVWLDNQQKRPPWSKENVPYHPIKNLHFPLKDIKRVVNSCQYTLNLNIFFYKPETGMVVKVTQLFNGLLPLKAQNMYMLAIIILVFHLPFLAKM